MAGYEHPPPSSLERRDAALSNEDVEAMWDRDPQRAFIEWTYRMNDIPSLVDGDVEFAERITSKLVNHLLVNGSVRYNLPGHTASFRTGAIGRSGWQIGARNMLHGISQASASIATKGADALAVEARVRSEAVARFSAKKT